MLQPSTAPVHTNHAPTHARTSATMSVAAMNGRAAAAASSDSDGSSQGSDASGAGAGASNALTAAFHADVAYFEAMIDLIPAKYYIRDEEAEAQHWMNSRFYRVSSALHKYPRPVCFALGLWRGCYGVAACRRHTAVRHVAVAHAPPSPPPLCLYRTRRALHRSKL